VLPVGLGEAARYGGSGPALGCNTIQHIPAEKGKPMKSLSLKLPPALDRELVALAQRRGISKSALVREALSRYLSSVPRPPEASFLERAKKFAGCLEGPSNLSSSAGHLQDYGR